MGILLEKLTSLDCLTLEQISYIDRNTLLKLKDCAIEVIRCNEKIAISHMFTFKLKLVADSLLNWFNRKFKNNNLELSNEQKTQYEISNPINWQDSRCFICNFPLQVRINGY